MTVARAKARHRKPREAFNVYLSRQHAFAAAPILGLYKVGASEQGVLRSTPASNFIKCPREGRRFRHSVTIEAGCVGTGNEHRSSAATATNHRVGISADWCRGCTKATTSSTTTAPAWRGHDDAATKLG